MEEKEYNIDIGLIAKLLLRRVWIIILSALVVGGISYAYTEYFIPRKYTSYTTLYVVNTVDYAVTVSASDIAAAQTLAESYVRFLTSNTTLENVSKDINGAYSRSQLKGMVSAQREDDTEILRVTVTCESKSDAKTIADLVALEGEKEIVRIVKTGKVSVVDVACDAYQSYPNTKNNTFFGLAVGFLVACAIIIIIEVCDKRIKSTNQLTELFGIDVIGIIPSMKGESTDE